MSARWHTQLSDVADRRHPAFVLYMTYLERFSLTFTKVRIGGPAVECVADVSGVNSGEFEERFHQVAGA